jgi:ADP-heptose:LPS heptosyltransferase
MVENSAYIVFSIPFLENRMSEKRPEKILVIKLSALGDFILALGAMEAIRKHHPGARITLLTTRPFVDIAERSGYCDEIIIDPRPKFYELHRWYSLFCHFNSGGFSKVYDLQMNDRTGVYYRLFLKKPQWSGMLTVDPALKALHAFKRHQQILARDGIAVGPPDISWMASDISPFNIAKPYVLLIPGSAPQHPEKRWSATRYGALGLRLVKEGYHVAVIGTAAEEETIHRVVKSCPEAINLCGQTSLYDIATLSRGAAAAFGNDTGPTHLVALSGCPTVAIFCTRASDPARSSPIGSSVQIVQAEDLEDISVADVYNSFKPRSAA